MRRHYLLINVERPCERSGPGRLNPPVQTVCTANSTLLVSSKNMDDGNELSGFTKASELDQSQYYLVNEDAATVLAGPYESYDDLQDDLGDDRAGDPTLKAVTGEVLQMLSLTSQQELNWKNE